MSPAPTTTWLRKLGGDLMQSLTWNEATMTWDEAGFTWDSITATSWSTEL